MCILTYSHALSFQDTTKEEKVQDQYHAVTAWTQALRRARLSDVRNASNKRLSTILQQQQPLNATLHSQVATKLTDGKPNGTTTNNLSAPVLLNSPIDDDDGIKAHFVPLCVPYYYTAAHGERWGIRKKAADQPR